MKQRFSVIMVKYIKTNEITMELEKNNRMNYLISFYENLLTRKQKEYIEEYYVDDFSLSEIAENYQVSRQAVYDNIQRTEKILEEYESKLHLYHNFLKCNQQLKDIQQYVSQHYTDQKLSELLKQLDQSLG